MEIELRRFEKTIFEIIEIEQHTCLIKLRLRVTILPLQTARAAYLNVWQLPDCLGQQSLLTLIIPPACLSAAAQSVEQRHRSEVSLQITQLILACGKNLRHRQPAPCEMSGQINECVILIAAGSYHTYDSRAVSIRHTVILTVTARHLQFLNVYRRLSTPLSVQVYQLLQNVPIILCQTFYSYTRTDKRCPALFF